MFPAGSAFSQGRSAIRRSAESDEVELLARCARSSSPAWDEFVARYRAVLERSARATLLRVLGSVREDDVEAVVESTLLGLVKDDHAALRSYSGRCSLSGYLQAITAKIALNHIRSERRKGWLRYRPLDAVADAPAPEPSGEELHQRMLLGKAMTQLPPRDRLILKLFHMDGASYREIASMAGISFNAVSPALIRAREKLRALIQGGR